MGTLSSSPPPASMRGDVMMNNPEKLAAHLVGAAVGFGAGSAWICPNHDGLTVHVQWLDGSLWTLTIGAEGGVALETGDFMPSAAMMPISLN